MQRFLVVDDHRLFLEGMRHLLSELGDDVSVELTDNVESGLAKIDQGNKYDLLLVDISLPEMDGYALIQSLNERGLIVPVVVVSSTSDISDIRRCLRMGASGFIHKNSSSEEMLIAVKKVLAGDIALPEDLYRQLDVVTRAKKQDQILAPSDKPEIGDRQLDVLKLMDEGLSNKQIARVLAISEATVKYHIGVLFKHLGVKNRTSCLHKARERKLIATE